MPDFLIGNPEYLFRALLSAESDKWIERPFKTIGVDNEVRGDLTFTLKFIPVNDYKGAIGSYSIVCNNCSVTDRGKIYKWGSMPLIPNAGPYQQTKFARFTDFEIFQLLRITTPARVRMFIKLEVENIAEDIWWKKELEFDLNEKS